MKPLLSLESLMLVALATILLGFVVPVKSTRPPSIEFGIGSSGG